MAKVAQYGNSAGIVSEWQAILVDFQRISRILEAEARVALLASDLSSVNNGVNNGNRLFVKAIEPNGYTCLILDHSLGTCADVRFFAGLLGPKSTALLQCADKVATGKINGRTQLSVPIFPVPISDAHCRGRHYDGYTTSTGQGKSATL